MKFEFTELAYNYDALEPHIDARTMEIHHGKHHAGYTNKLNSAIEGTSFEGLSIEEILKNAKDIPAIRNNAGGYYNHNLFWEIMTPSGNKNVSTKLKKAIDNTFGSFEVFKAEFIAAAATQFGSGWAWLYVHNGELYVGATPNQDNPIMGIELEGEPILGIDIWEHAYYLKYQNLRPDYINAFFEVIDWNKVSEKYEKLV
ncbi:superoxide dismutase [Aquimarina rhabdastrellae]